MPKGKTAILAFLLAPGLLVAAAFFLPYSHQAQMSITGPVFLNLPCERALAQSTRDETSSLTLQASGHGFGSLGFNRDGHQINLLKKGVFTSLDCTLEVRLRRGDVVYLPAPMPFTAQGVVPTATSKKPAGSPLTWRRIEGFR